MCIRILCNRRKKNTLALVRLNVKHLCEWLGISLAKQFQRIQAISETQGEKQNGALLTGMGCFKESGWVLRCCAPTNPHSLKAVVTPRGPWGKGIWLVPCGRICLGMFLGTTGYILTPVK